MGFRLKPIKDKEPFQVETMRNTIRKPEIINDFSFLQTKNSRSIKIKQNY